MALQRVTLKSIADEVGCHVTVVSKVLNASRGNTSVGESTAIKIRQVAERLGYRPSTVARMMRGQMSRWVGILVRSTHQPEALHTSTLELISGLNSGLQAHDYAMNWICLDRWDSDCKALDERLLDGIIAVNWSSDTSKIEKRVSGVTDHLVWLNSNVDHAFGVCRQDSAYHGEAICKIAKSKGYRRIILLTCPEAKNWVHLHAIASIRSFCPLLELELEEFPMSEPPSPVALKAMGERLEAGVAVVAISVRIAEDFLLFAAHLQKRLGVDYGFACCDNRRDFSNVWPILTRLDLSYSDLGLRAAAMLVRDMAQKCPQASELVRCEVIGGDTL